MLLLFGVALAVRLPNLMLIPRFQDEGIEVLWGLDIARGAALPLTGSDPYYGPLFSYVVALGFHLFGPGVVLPRVIAATAGALVVPMTYWLGRATCGRAVGLIAAMLALSSRSLITVSSHYGWSNSLSPLLATATLVACCEGYSRKSAGWLIAGGVLAGLTVQTHPITATVVVGIAAWSLMPKGVAWVTRRRVLCAAVAAGVVAYGPVLWATAQSGLSISSIGATRAYSFQPMGSLMEYPQRLIELCHAVWLDALAGFPPYTGNRAGSGIGAGSFDEIATGPARIASLVVGLAFLAYALGAAAASRAKSLVACAVLASLLLFPIAVQTALTRYVSYLLPLVYILLGEGLVRLSRRIPLLGARSSPDGGPHRGRRAVLAGMAALTAMPLLTMPHYYERISTSAGTNQPFFDLRETLKANGACRDAVILEDVAPTLAGRDRTWAYFNRESIRQVLTLDACPVEIRSAEWVRQELDERGTGTWAILSPPTARRAAETVTLTKVREIPTVLPLSPALRVALYASTQRRDD